MAAGIAGSGAYRDRVLDTLRQPRYAALSVLMLIVARSASAPAPGRSCGFARQARRQRRICATTLTRPPSRVSRRPAVDVDAGAAVERTRSSTDGHRHRHLRRTGVRRWSASAASTTTPATSCSRRCARRAADLLVVRGFVSARVLGGAADHRRPRPAGPVDGTCAGCSRPRPRRRRRRASARRPGRVDQPGRTSSRRLGRSVYDGYVELLGRPARHERL